MANSFKDYCQFYKRFAFVSAYLVLLASHARAVSVNGGSAGERLERRPISAPAQGHWRGSHHHALDNQAAEGVLVPTFALPDGNGGSAGDPPAIVEDTGHGDLYGTASVHSVSKVEFNSVSSNDAEEATTKGTSAEDIPPATESASPHRHGGGNHHGNAGSNMALFVDTGSPLHLGFVNIVDGGYLGAGRHVNSVGNTISGPVPVVYPGPLPVAQVVPTPFSHNTHVPLTHRNSELAPATSSISTSASSPEMAKKPAPVTPSPYPPATSRSAIQREPLTHFHSVPTAHDVQNESSTMAPKNIGSHSEPSPSISGEPPLASEGKVMPRQQFESEFPQMGNFKTTTPMAGKSDQKSDASNVPNIPRHFVPITVAPRRLPTQNQRGSLMAGKESKSMSEGTEYVRVTRGGSPHSMQDRPLHGTEGEVLPSQRSGQEAKVESVNVPILEGGFVPVTESTTTVRAPSTEGGFVPITDESIVAVTQNFSALELQGGFVPVTQGITTIDAEDDFSYTTQSESLLEPAPEIRPGSAPLAKSTNNPVTSSSLRVPNIPPEGGRPPQNRDTVSENVVGGLQRGRTNQHRFGSNFNTLQGTDGLARSSVIFNFGAPRPSSSSSLASDGRGAPAQGVRLHSPPTQSNVAGSRVLGTRHGAITTSSVGRSGVVVDRTLTRPATDPDSNFEGSLAAGRPVQKAFSSPESRQAPARQEQAIHVHDAGVDTSPVSKEGQGPPNGGQKSDTSINNVVSNSPDDYETSSSVISVQRYSVGYEAAEFPEVDASVQTNGNQQ